MKASVAIALKGLNAIVNEMNIPMKCSVLKLLIYNQFPLVDLHTRNILFKVIEN